MFSSGLMWINYPLIKIKNKYVLFHKVREKENIPKILRVLIDEHLTWKGHITGTESKNSKI